jgi:hypothetical protein
MHPTLTYEVQKAIVEERLRNAAVAAQYHVLAPDRTGTRRLTMRVRRPRHPRLWAVVRLFG